jgi:hypothetical protein
MLNFRHIGDWNPQLLRELKSRLNWRNGSIAIVISMVSQLILVLSQYSKLTQNSIIERSQFYGFPDRYCVAILKGKCTTDISGNIEIDWPKWWGVLAVNISWGIFFGLIVGGVYLLASSFSQEEKRGTIDCIRLTPQKASSFFIGKMLGVPALVYLGSALAIPLQFYAAQQAGIARSHLLGWDLLMVVVAILLYQGAILAIIWFKSQPILLTVATVFIVNRVLVLGTYWYKPLNYYESVGVMSWGRLNLGYCLLYFSLASGIYWLSQAMKCCYLRPTAVVLSKKQSYLWSANFHLIALGFYIYREFYFAPGVGGSSTCSACAYIYIPPITFFVWLLLLIPMLLPRPQSLLEWSRRYPQKSKKRLHSMIWDDQSPGILAVGINGAIALVMWNLLLLRYLNWEHWTLEQTIFILSMVIAILLYVACSAIAHWISFWQVSNRSVWRVVLIGSFLFLPPLFLRQMFPISSDEIDTHNRILAGLSWLYQPGMFVHSWRHKFGDYTLPISVYLTILVLLLALIWWFLKRLRKAMALRAIAPNS